MSAPVLSWLLIAHRLNVEPREEQKRVAPLPPPLLDPIVEALHPQSQQHPTRTPPKGHTDRHHQSPQASLSDPMSPTLRANPYPEVTDLFCRLPLPTLFYQLEAVHLGDLLRLSVRPGTKIILSFGFSRAIESAPDTTRSVMLCRALYPISR